MGLSSRGWYLIFAVVIGFGFVFSSSHAQDSLHDVFLDVSNSPIASTSDQIVREAELARASLLDSRFSSVESHLAELNIKIDRVLGQCSKR